MLDDLKKVIKENRKQLPLLSHYWEMGEANKNEHKEYSLQVISIAHNTSKYTPFTLYKPISTTINLSYYE